LPYILGGLAVTVEVALLSLVMSVVLGILGALGKLSNSVVLNKICTAYTTIVRGVPDLILMLLFFYGGQIGVNSLTEALGWGYFNIDPFIAGFLTIGFIYGAYMVETFRGAILSIKRGQVEAGISFGMNNLMVFRRITFPLMVRFAVPSFMNNWLVLIKSTALISIIGLEDIVRRSSLAGLNTKQPFTFLFLASLIYVLITSVSVYLIRYLEKKFQVVE
jgi:His/Glu/Gln/Arg/opine family amino acid ABC transporter permease subunit